MRYIMTLLLYASTTVNFAQNTEPDSSQTLNDVVIKETFETKHVEEKLQFHFQYDFSQAVQIPERVDWNSVDEASEDLSHKNWYSFSFRLSMPEFAKIRPAPVKVFHIQFKEIDSWKLNIFKSDGSLFRTIDGKGNPPEQIAWNGLSNDHKPLIPGKNYSYSFTPIDKAGNKKTFPGETFRIPSYYIEREDSIWIGIAAPKLFSYDGLVLLESADEYANEVASLIRYYGVGGDITLESTHPKRLDFIELVLDQLKINKETQSSQSANENKIHCIVCIE